MNIFITDSLLWFVFLTGNGVRLPLNQPVAYMVNGAFGEYQVLSEKQAIPLPAMKKEFVSLLVSGLTAGVSLDLIGQIKPGKRRVNNWLVPLDFYCQPVNG